MRRRIVSIALLLMSIAGPAAAQIPNAKHWEASVGGGAAFPFGDFGDISDTGWLVTARLGYYVSPTFCLGAEYAYYDLAVKDEFLAPFQIPGFDIDANVYLHQASAFGKFLLTPKAATPYLRAQMGLYQLGVSVEVDTIDESSSDSEFGLGGGGGVQFRGNGAIGGFVDVIYHAVLTEDETTTFLSVQGGLSFLFGGRE